MKRGIIICLLLILSLSFVFADSCWIQSGVCPGGDNFTVMKLSDLLNAHGDVYDQGVYESSLCCNFTSNNPHTCGTANPPLNKILGLSSATNAHAQIRGLTDYEINICFGDLMCTSGDGSCPVEYDIQMLSLTAPSNSHLGGFLDYNKKICCRQVTCDLLGGDVCEIGELCLGDSIYAPDANFCCDETCVSPFWDFCGECGSGLFNICDETECHSILEECYYENGIGLTCTPCSLMTCDKYDIGDCAEDRCDLGCEEFGANCVELNCGVISRCADYLASGSCEMDFCERADSSVQINNPSITCGDGFECSCWWDEEEQCVSKWVGINEPECGDGVCEGDEDCLTCESDCGVCSDCTGVCGDDCCEDGLEDCLTCESDCGVCNLCPREIGECLYDEMTSDDCSDGFLEYSWTVNWVWDEENSDDINPDGWFYDDNDEKWHCDPYVEPGIRQSEMCAFGSSVVPCPAKISLPFFTLETFLVTIIILGIIYLRGDLKKREKHKKKIRKRKK